MFTISLGAVFARIKFSGLLLESKESPEITVVNSNVPVFSVAGLVVCGMIIVPLIEIHVWDGLTEYVRLICNLLGGFAWIQTFNHKNEYHSQQTLQRARRTVRLHAH